MAANRGLYKSFGQASIRSVSSINSSRTCYIHTIRDNSWKEIFKILHALNLTICKIIQSNQFTSLIYLHLIDFFMTDKGNFGEQRGI